MSCAFLQVPWTELWVPDLGIYNGVGQPQFANPPQTNRVVLFPTGKVLWVPQMTIQSVCKAKAKDQEQVELTVYVREKSPLNYL